MTREAPCLLDYDGASLVGILHQPETPSDVGIVMLVGGPQYRVGSHRQYVLLARHFAAAGLSVLRADHRGIGDSDGDEAGFENIGPDIRAIVDGLLSTVPGVKRVVLWGLCDAASAAMLNAYSDQRIAGLVLVNPWARTEEGEAKTLLHRYYFARLTSAEFWRELFGGAVDLRRAIRDLVANIGKAAGLRPARQAPIKGDRPGPDVGGPLPVRMAAGLERFSGPVLVILSGDDLTATEFSLATRSSRRWKSLISKPDVDIRELPDANHTFSNAIWRGQVADWTVEWIRKL